MPAPPRTTPLRRLTYSGNTITDSGDTIADTSDDRVYHLQRLRQPARRRSRDAAGIAAASRRERPAAPGRARGGGRASSSGSVTRDGVAWTYAYLNLRASRRAASAMLYDRLTVTGPNGFNQVYEFDQVGAAATCWRA